MMHRRQNITRHGEAIEKQCTHAACKDCWGKFWGKIICKKEGKEGKRGRKGRLSPSRSPGWGWRGEPGCDPQALHVDVEKEKEQNPPSRWSESGEWSEV